MARFPGFRAGWCSDGGSPCRGSGRDFLLHTAESGAPELRSENDVAAARPAGGRGAVWRRYWGWLRRWPALRRSPVLLRLVGGGIPLLAAGFGLVLVAAALGPYAIPLSHTFDILLQQMGLGASSAPETEQAIVASIRLPRIALALTVGAALGVAGAVMQGLFRNPMADPGIIGVSTGGALGAVAAIATGAQAAFALALPAMSFAGATGALALVYAVAAVGGRFSMSVLLLSGVAVSAFIAAIISAIILFTENLEAQRDMLFWLAGGLDASRWSEVRLSLPFVLFGIAVAAALARDLNLLMVSEDEARALGVRVGLTRNALLLAASLITGTAVAFSGAIAFVGLIVPHALRLVIGADHRALIPLSALGGGVFMLAADTLARLVIAPAEVSVGIITALVGAPFFLALLIRNKARASML